jgi:hypothetical protein
MTRLLKSVAHSTIFIFVIAASPKAFTQSICATDYFVKETECGRPDLAANKLKECEIHFMAIMSMCNPAAERQWYYRVYYEKNCEKADVCSPTCRIVRGQIPNDVKLSGKCD